MLGVSRVLIGSCEPQRVSWLIKVITLNSLTHHSTRSMKNRQVIFFALTRNGIGSESCWTQSSPARGWDWNIFIITKRVFVGVILIRALDSKWLALSNWLRETTSHSLLFNCDWLNRPLRKYHNIIKIVVWVVRHVNLTFALPFVPDLHEHVQTCNVGQSILY